MLSFKRIYGAGVPLYPSEGRVEMRECSREEYQIGERKVVRIDAYQEVVIKEEALEEISLLQDIPCLRRSNRLQKRVPPLANRLAAAPSRKWPFSCSFRVRQAQHCHQQIYEADLIERLRWSISEVIAFWSEWNGPPSHSIPCPLPPYATSLRFHPVSPTFGVFPFHTTGIRHACCFVLCCENSGIPHQITRWNNSSALCGFIREVSCLCWGHGSGNLGFDHVSSFLFCMID